MTVPSFPRILFVIETLDLGGAEVLVVQLSRYLVGHGHEVGICVLSNTSSRLVDQAIGFGARVFLSSGREPRIRNVIRTIKNFRPDVIHSHLSTADLFARVAAVFFPRVAVVTTFHNCAYDVRPRALRTLARRIAERITARRNSSLVGVSHAVANHYSRVLGRKVLTIYHGINFADFKRSEFAADARAIRSALPVRDSSFLIVSVGNFKAEKGHDQLFKALAKIRRAAPETHLLLVGDGPLRAAYERQIRDLGIGDCVTLAGQQPSAAPYIVAADLLVHPSVSEGLGLVLLEAIALETPVLATHCEGPEEIFADTPGIVVPHERLSAELLQRVTSAPADGSVLLARRNILMEKFDLGKTAEKLSSLYCELSARSRPEGLA